MKYLDQIEREMKKLHASLSEKDWRWCAAVKETKLVAKTRLF